MLITFFSSSFLPKLALSSTITLLYEYCATVPLKLFSEEDG